LAVAAGDNPKITVLGAGAIGCFVGGAWLAAGLDVSFVGRERVQREIGEYGLSLSDVDGWRTDLPSSRIAFDTRPQALRKADIVLLTVKTFATEAAAKEIARHARPGTRVISFQNGVGAAERLRKLLPRHQVLQGMVPYHVVQPAPGRWHRATFGELTVESSETTRALAARIGDRPGRLLLSDDMRAIAWGKLLYNLNNAVNALSRETILAELRQRDYRRVLAAAIVETLGLLDAAGIEPAKIGLIPPKLLPQVMGAPKLIFRNFFLKLQKIDPKARGSMSGDYENGRPTEVDDLNGEVVRLAATLGRNAPVNKAIVDLVKMAEAGVERRWTARELRAHVLERHKGLRGFGY
jgi:2-dehydropantoate 2-reductase